MNPMKKLMLIFAAASLLVFPSCGAWPEQRRLDAIAVIDTMAANGDITSKQHAAMIEAINSMAEGFTLEDLLIKLAELGIAIGGTLLGVRGLRGPAKPLPKGSESILAMLVEREKAKVVKKTT